MNRKNGSEGNGSDARARLLGRRQKLLSLLKIHQEWLNTCHDGADSIDEAFEEIANTVGSELVEATSRELLYVETALEKIFSGNYGVCEGCGKKISATRLLAIPYAIRCVVCQEEADHNFSQQPSRRRGRLVSHHGEESVRRLPRTQAGII